MMTTQSIDYKRWVNHPVMVYKISGDSIGFLEILLENNKRMRLLLQYRRHVAFLIHFESIDTSR